MPYEISEYRSWLRSKCAWRACWSWSSPWQGCLECSLATYWPLMGTAVAGSPGTPLGMAILMVKAQAVCDYSHSSLCTDPCTSCTVIPHQGRARSNVTTYLYSRVICNPEYFLSLCAFLFSVQDKFLQCMVTDVQKIIAIFVSRSEAAHSWVRKLTWCSCETFEKLPENFKLKSCGCAGGACGYTQLTGTPYGNKIAAGSSAIYQNGLGCGQCYDVRDSSCHI